MSDGAFAGQQWSARQQGTGRRYVGIGVVVLLHLAFVWALLNGLATRVVEVVEKPVETRIIEPVKPPPPPPLPVKTVQVQPPKIKIPPPPFVPPPEVHVAPPPEPVITHQAVPVPTPVAPPPAPVETPAKPVSHEAGVVCPNSDKVRGSMVYPQEAQDNNITGDVLISFVVDTEGHVTDEKVEKSADPLLDRAAFNAVRQFNCISQGQPARVQVPFSFNLN